MAGGDQAAARVHATKIPAMRPGPSQQHSPPCFWKTFCKKLETGGDKPSTHLKVETYGRGGSKRATVRARNLVEKPFLATSCACRSRRGLSIGGLGTSVHLAIFLLNERAVLVFRERGARLVLASGNVVPVMCWLPMVPVSCGLPIVCPSPVFASDRFLDPGTKCGDLD